MFNFNKLLSNDSGYLPEENQVREWELISKTYGPPRKTLGSLEGLDKDTQEKALLGVTTYLFKDKLTGELKREQLLGTDESILEDLFIKVKLYGQQHIKDENGEIFVLSKYVPQVTNPLDLPMR